MPDTVLLIRRTVVLFGLILLGALLAQAQGPRGDMTGKMAEEVYDNIQALTGTPADQLGPAMHVIEVATGMDCLACHEADDRAADTKATKETARRMIRMVSDLNKNHFNGEQVITCYTCHQGHPEPAATPVLPMFAPPEEVTTNLPTVDQILQRYVEALGGEQAIRKVTSRVISGTTTIPAGPGGNISMPALLERSEKTPNLFVNVYRTPAYTISDGFDGGKAWSQSQQGRVVEPRPLEQGRAARQADFYLPLNLKQQYVGMMVRRLTRINDRDAYEVVGTPKGDLPERFYFDAVTGLLLRKATVLPTPVGDSPYEVNYADYRDTGSGVKFPYRITINPPGPRTTLYGSSQLVVTKVQDNAPLDDAKFAVPPSRPAPAR